MGIAFAICRAVKIKSLAALKELGLDTIITYPNPDPGGEVILKEYDNWRHVEHFRFIPNLGEKYLPTMRKAKVVVGNSSSGLIETPYCGVPCVNIGDRQKGRARAGNVIDAGYDRGQIKRAVLEALKMPRRYDNPFAGGGAAVIAAKLEEYSGDKRLLRKRGI